MLPRGGFFSGDDAEPPSASGGAGFAGLAAFCKQTQTGAASFARALAGGRLELADDAVQEAYVRMMHCWTRQWEKPFDDNQRLLLTIVRHEVRRLQDRAKRAPLLDDRSEDVASGTDIAAAVTSAAALRAFLNALPDHERAVGVLYAELGMGPSEIAEVLGILSSTARTRLQRVRAKAAVFYQLEGGDRDDG